uniref:Uncharacterized protein n=1 Tax=Cyprinus carpio TaxID=7962 RepID=A0A8C2FBE1_CYPCA
SVLHEDERVTSFPSSFSKTDRCCFCLPAETDDYAEIIDEEDTYTMPSSKYPRSCHLLSVCNCCLPGSRCFCPNPYGFPSQILTFFFSCLALLVC